MNAREALMPSAEAAKRAIVYEMPLNERMRNFLRLDFLYHQAVHHHTRSDPWSTRAAVDALLEILAITSRGDLRGEVLKDLERQMSQLSTFGTRPGVDASRLHLLLTKMHRLREELTAAGALFLQKLRDSEFLNAIKHRSTIPGGTCEFDLPDYTHWLNQPDEVRGADFAHWLGIIRPLGDAVSELLWITRENARPSEETAPGGNFQIMFERDRPVQLLRITLAGASRLFPEVSGSHHRCSLRFLRSLNSCTCRPMWRMSSVSRRSACAPCTAEPTPFTTRPRGRFEKIRTSTSPV